jgi:hypothetical protein
VVAMTTNKSNQLVCAATSLRWPHPDLTPYNMHLIEVAASAQNGVYVAGIPLDLSVVSLAVGRSVSRNHPSCPIVKLTVVRSSRSPRSQ